MMGISDMVIAAISMFLFFVVAALSLRDGDMQGFWAGCILGNTWLVAVYINTFGRNE